MMTATTATLPRRAWPLGAPCAALCAALSLIAGAATVEAGAGLASEHEYGLPLAAASAPPPRPEHLLASAPVGAAPVAAPAAAAAPPRSTRPAQARAAPPQAAAPVMAERTRPPLRIDPRYRWSSGEMR